MGHIIEVTGISIPKIQNNFVDFVQVYGSRKFQGLVNPPSPDNMEELEECMEAYRIAGLPGCIGPVDM